LSGATPGSSSVEIESKYDVDDGTPVPDWSGIPGIARVGDAEPRDLDARYVDTVDGALARVGVAVRRRQGGPDEGWHVKAPAPGGRSETHWPLGEIGDADEAPVVPEEIQDAVAAWAHGPFLPLARVRNHRTAYALLDADGGLVAEFVDDRVRARDERQGTESAWRDALRRGRRRRVRGGRSPRGIRIETGSRPRSLRLPTRRRPPTLLRRAGRGPLCVA
jgi:CYTH domain